MLLVIPLALAEQLQASLVDHQMQRAERDDLRLPSGEAAAAPAQGRVVWDAQRLPEQPQHARGEALSLAQGEVEDEPQHQHQLDRRVRVPGLAAGRAPPRCLPPGQGILIEPERQVATPLQASLVGRPVLDPVASLRDAMAAGGIMLEGHARERNGLTAAGLLASAPCTNALAGDRINPGRFRQRAAMPEDLNRERMPFRWPNYESLLRFRWSMSAGDGQIIMDLAAIMFCRGG